MGQDIKQEITISLTSKEASMIAAGFEILMDVLKGMDDIETKGIALKAISSTLRKMEEAIREVADVH